VVGFPSQPIKLLAFCRPRPSFRPAPYNHHSFFDLLDFVPLRWSPEGEAVATSDVQRKLTAILCTAVVGYSRLMGDDPEGTLKTLIEYREVFSDKIQE